MAFTFNGSTMDFGGAIAEVRSASFESTSREIEVTNAGDSDAIYEAGNRDWTGTIEVNGDISTALGTSGTLTMTFQGNAETLANSLLVGRSVTGSVDNGVITTLTFKQGQA